MTNYKTILIIFDWSNIRESDLCYNQKRAISLEPTLLFFLGYEQQVAI